MEAREIVRGILQKYSCSKYEETHCSTKELERDLVGIMESYIRSEQDTREMHEAWLRIQGNKERSKTFMQRLFT